MSNAPKISSQKNQDEDAIAAKDAGLTLVELLVVLAILALFAGLAVPQVLRYLGSARTSTAKTQISALSSAVELYYLDVGTYPGQDDGLDSLVDAPQNKPSWNGPYLKKRGGLLDPWGNPYLYQYPGDHGDFDILSLGRDKAAGGEGEDQDVVGW